MPLSLSNASVPLFRRGLHNLSSILAKAEAHVAAGHAEESALIAARLAPDMFPLPRQIQIASDGAKLSMARLAGLTPPSFPDTETTLAQLRARIDATRDYLETVPSEVIDAREGATITLKLGQTERRFLAEDFLRQFALPNFYFHVVTAYDVLRHAGVALTKSDYLGAFE